MYEADVEQALNLAEYYHIRSIPTIMAFDNKNLTAPIWQRTASSVLPSSSNDLSETMDNNDEFSHSNDLDVMLDPSFQTTLSMDSSKETKPDQTLLIVDQMPSKIINDLIRFCLSLSDSEEDKTIDQCLLGIFSCNISSLFSL